MSISGIFFALVLLILTAVWVLWPLLRGATSDKAMDDAIARQRERVLVYYERVLANIRDLDEDLSTGKISPEEHAMERAMWVERGIGLLQLLDELADDKSLTDTVAVHDEQIDSVIESRIAAYRQKQKAI